jgi:hypothetical protein
MTAPMAALRPVWASEMTGWTPVSPRAFRLRRKAAQKVPSSLSPTSRPSTSRPPSAVTPVAITTARLTTRPSTRALRQVASTNTYGKLVWASEREPNVATSASSSPQIRETSLLEMPASTPRALTRSSTLRVETPCT